MPQQQLAFLKHKKKIDAYLDGCITDKESVFKNHSLSTPVFEYLRTFVQSGKSVRGSLFLSAISEFTTEKKASMYLPIAAGIELIHSALLIQDDFMDQDDSRRGMDAFHSIEYEKAKKNAYSRPGIYVPSAVMCATDIFFFIAFEHISKVLGTDTVTVWRYLAEEYSHVGFAQWQDVTFAYESKDSDTFEEIENMYRYKTARYTFVMPVLIAAHVSGLEKDTIARLEKIFEAIGMIFQIRDDYLNLFGTKKTTGKSVGGDIVENKKTMYRYYLFLALEETSIKKYLEVRKLYGKHDLTKEEVALLQEAHTQLGVTAALEKIITQKKAEIFTELQHLPVSEEFKDEVKKMTHFVESRQK